MDMRVVCYMLAVTAIVAGSGSALAAGQVAPEPPKRAACFYVNEFQSWRAPDDKTIYIRVNLDRYYRLDLSGTCQALLWPGSHLIMNVRGPDTICSAIDWDLKVNEDIHGIAEPCIVKTMTELSPAEAAAIPKKFKP